MKKAFAVPLFLIAGLFGFWGLSRGESPANLNAEPGDSRYQQLVQEAGRDKEMLAIWKNHVRTLTRERDEAYKKLEELKSQGETAFGPEAADREAMVREKDEALKRVGEFSRQMGNLQIENEVLKARSEKLDIVESELKEARAYFASLIDELTAQNKKLQDEAEREAGELQERAKRLEAEKKEAQQALEATRAQVQTLEAGVQKDKKIENGLQAKNNKLSDDNRRLESERQAALASAKELQGTIEQLKADLGKSKQVEEDLKKRLGANAADLANLRENFGELLQPIVSSFEERKK